LIIIKEIISDKQAIYLIIIFTLGSTLLIGTGGDAKMDMWFAVMLGMLLGLLVATMYSRILYNFPQKDIFDINTILFGKLIGNILNLFFIFYSFILAALVLDNFVEFISTVGLPDTPKIAPVIFIVALCIWGVKAGLEVLGRCSGVFIIILFGAVISITVLSLSKLNFDYIRPFMYEGITPILKGTFSAFSFPFAENVIFLMLFSGLRNRTSALKVYWIGLIVSGISLVIIAVRNIMFVGVDTLSKNYFPTYIVVSRISIGEFLQRIETTVIVSFLLAGFIKVCCCLLATCKGVAKLFGFDDYRFIVTPIALMVFTFSFIVYNNIIETVNWAPHVYPIYAFFFQIILPFIIFVAAEIKIKKTKQKGMR
jgi:spore germination protein KB